MEKIKEDIERINNIKEKLLKSARDSVDFSEDKIESVSCNEEAGTFVFSNPEPTYKLYLTDGFVINLNGKIPNRFHSFMLRVVFGIKIEKYK